jgi:putative ABC transport system permease protein
VKTRRALRGAARAAWAVVHENRWRSALTLAVCALGTAGVIVAGAIGSAQVAEIQERLRAVGGRLIVVSPNTVPPYPGRTRQLEHFVSLEPGDAAALRELQGVETAVPVVARNSTLRLGSTASRVRLVGTTAEYAPLRLFATGRGRFLELADDGNRVIVLGQAVSRELAPQGVLLGESVWLAGQPYEVVGILRPQGVNFAGEDEDHQVFIPLDTYRGRIANRLWLSHVYVQVTPDADPAVTVQQVGRLLRSRHNRLGAHVDDVTVRDMAEVAAQQSSLSTTALWVVSLASGLLLLLGVVGIATLMVQVVRQRRAEIGLRRAIGATPFDIAAQLFVEAMSLAGVGVVAGLAIGVAGTLIGQALWGGAVNVDRTLVVVTALASLGASATACLVPARIAGRVEPAAALRL